MLREKRCEPVLAASVAFMEDRQPTVGQRNPVCESDAHALRVEAVVLARSPRNRRTKMTTRVCVAIRSKHGASEFEP